MTNAPSSASARRIRCSMDLQRGWLHQRSRAALARARPARVYHGATRRRMDHRSLCVLRNPPELEHQSAWRDTASSAPSTRNRPRPTVRASPPVAIDEDGDGVPVELPHSSVWLASRRNAVKSRCSSDRAELRHQLQNRSFLARIDAYHARRNRIDNEKKIAQLCRQTENLKFFRNVLQQRRCMYASHLSQDESHSACAQFELRCAAPTTQAARVCSGDCRSLRLRQGQVLVAIPAHLLCVA